MILSIDSHDYNTFGDVTIKQQCDGYGISGCSTAQLTFNVTADEYEEKKPQNNAVVMITTGIGTNAKTYVYYIASRSKSGGKVSFTCYDRMAFTDCHVNIESVPFDESGKISASELVTTIAGICGINNVDSGISSMGFFGALTFSKTEITGQTARMLLEEISKAWCGYFKVSYSNTLYFVPFGYGTVTGNVFTEYAKITEGFEKGPIAKIKISDGNNTYYAGSSTADIFETLSIDTKFASQELADALMVRTEGTVYQGWNCSKAVVSQNTLPDITADITFYNDSKLSRFSNVVTLNFSASGVFFSGGANSVTENEFEYMGALSRKIDQCIKNNELLGNRTVMTRYQGLVHLAPENASEAENTSYSYSEADGNGVVEFSGAMTSKIVPSSAEINEDKTEALIAYGDKKYKYDVKWDNGKITGFTKTEVKDEL